MTLALDLQRLGQAISEPSILNAISLALGGSTASAAGMIGSSPDKDFPLQILSGIVHEKRHFLDFMLSNYGAFRFRQFLELYLNLPPILTEGRRAGSLCLPLDIYADEVRREVLGVKESPPSLLKIAEKMTIRRGQIEDDRKKGGFGKIKAEIGGEAQFESLAFLAQLEFLATVSPTATLGFYRSLFDLATFRPKYVLFLDFAVANGLVPASVIAENQVVTEPLLLECILFAALQTDHTPLHAPDGKLEYGYAADRFSAIFAGLRQAKPKFFAEKNKPAAWHKLDFNECWAAVNEVCVTLFGRTVVEQMDVDIAYFEQKLDLNLPGDVGQIIKDYVLLRRKLFEDFKLSPERYISSAKFVTQLVDEIQPNITIVANDGVLGDPPPEFKLLLGYKLEPPRPFAGADYYTWWWSCAPIPKENPHLRKPTFGFEQPGSWHLVAQNVAPIGKLLMNGRRLRTILGPELKIAEEKLIGSGIKLKFYPGFDRSNDIPSAEVIYYYAQREQLRCGISGVVLTRPEGKILSPWMFSRWPLLKNWIVEKLGGNNRACLDVERHWGPILVSDDVFEEVQLFMMEGPEDVGGVSTLYDWYFNTMDDGRVALRPFERPRPG